MHLLGTYKYPTQSLIQSLDSLNTFTLNTLSRTLLSSERKATGTTTEGSIDGEVLPSGGRRLCTTRKIKVLRRGGDGRGRAMRLPAAGRPARPHPRAPAAHLAAAVYLPPSISPIPL
jgi:hypothetical protein